MDYQEFTHLIEEAPRKDQMFLSILYLSGCRVSEALALTYKDLNIYEDMLYIQFKRLKGSKQNSPQQIPLIYLLRDILTLSGVLFPFSRTTAYRIVKRYFPELYPHYFRMNFIMQTGIALGGLAAKRTVSITWGAMEHYEGDFDLKKVGELWQHKTREGLK